MQFRQPHSPFQASHLQSDPYNHAGLVPTLPASIAPGTHVTITAKAAFFHEIGHTARVVISVFGHALTLVASILGHALTLVLMRPTASTGLILTMAFAWRLIFMPPPFQDEQQAPQGWTQNSYHHAPDAYDRIIEIGDFEMRDAATVFFGDTDDADGFISSIKAGNYDKAATYAPGYSLFHSLFIRLFTTARDNLPLGSLNQQQS